MQPFSRFLFFIIILTTSPIYSQPLNQAINDLIEQTLPHSHVGILVKEIHSGQIIYAREAHKLLNPASNIKLFTAVAGLLALSPDYRYTTSLSQDRHNVYITFSGDPSLTTDDLKQLLMSLQKLGLKTIHGNVIIDSSQFKPPYYADGVSHDDLGWYYAAPSSAVILNENAEPYDFISAKKIGMPIDIKPLSPDKNLTLVNKVLTENEAQEKNHCDLHIDIKANNTLRLYGCLAYAEQPKSMRLAIPNPVLAAKNVIKKTLREYAIQLQGKIIEGRTPSAAKVITTHQSEDFGKLMAHMLEESDNLYADSFTKRLAYLLTGEGTYKQGVFAIKKILTQHFKLNMEEISLYDGLGTRYNSVTPSLMVTFLTALYHDKGLKPILLKALPHMGSSGTLKERMKNTPLEDKVIAKTGGMHDISALSGYLTTRQNKTLVFSIISNEINGDINKAKELEDKILLMLFLRAD